MNFDYLRMGKKDSTKQKYEHHEINNFWEAFKNTIDKLNPFQIEDFKKRKKK